MTTSRDQGGRSTSMLACPLNDTNLYRSLVLALRDLRLACGRDQVSGEGNGNESWIGLCLGMVVLDTLSGEGPKVGERWMRLLTTHDVLETDAKYIYALRNSLLHGYGLPKAEDLDNRLIALTPDVNGFAVDTEHDDYIRLSVPVFNGHLVERIASEAHEEWDTSLIDTDFQL